MKRGQITVFIIIGALLLLTIGTVLYINSSQVQAPFQEAVVVPAEIKPAYDAVVECMDATAKQGLLKMGLQGGYIDVPDEITHQPLSYLSIDNAGVVKVPYWYYEGKSKIPTISSMERQLAVYMKQNIEDCADFSKFPDKITVMGENSPIVKFAEDNVVLRLTWPLQIELPGKTQKIQDFTTTIDVPMKNLWDTARKVMEAENNKEWLENLTIDLVTGNPDVPTDGFVFTCRQPKWRISDVQNTIQTILAYNLPTIRVANTQYVPYDESLSSYVSAGKQYRQMQNTLLKNDELILPKNVPEDSFEYFRMTLDAGLTPVDYKTAFVYNPEWGMKLNPQPRDGSMLKPNKLKSAGKIMSFLCMQQWHFTYDIVYPVEFQVVDNTALNGAGFVFNIAFPVMIKSNKPARGYVSNTLFDYEPQATDFCENFGTQTADLRGLGFETGKPAGEPMQGVNFEFNCLTQNCDLGASRQDDGIHRLRTYLPEGCANPTITAQKEGYLSNSQVLSSGVTEIQLTKLKTMTFDVVKHQYSPAQDVLGGAEPLKDTETATILMTMKNNDQYKAFPNENTIDLAEDTMQYDISIFLTDVTGTPIGGYEVENVTIPYSEVINSNHITFHAFTQNAPSSDEERAQFAQYLYEATYKDKLQPTLS